MPYSLQSPGTPPLFNSLMQELLLQKLFGPGPAGAALGPPQPQLDVPRFGPMPGLLDQRGSPPLQDLIGPAPTVRSIADIIQFNRGLDRGLLGPGGSPRGEGGGGGGGQVIPFPQRGGLLMNERGRPTPEAYSTGMPRAMAPKALSALTGMRRQQGMIGPDMELNPTYPDFVTVKRGMRGFDPNYKGDAYSEHIDVLDPGWWKPVK